MEDVMPTRKENKNYNNTRFADPHEGPSRWGSNTVTDNPLQLHGILCQ